MATIKQPSKSTQAAIKNPTNHKLQYTKSTNGDLAPIAQPTIRLKPTSRSEPTRAITTPNPLPLITISQNPLKAPTKKKPIIKTNKNHN